MTQGERATAVLNYLEGLDSKAVINILNPMLDDEALELVYLGLVRDGVLESDEEEEEQDGMAAGLAYVREQLAEDELTEIKAQVDRSYRCHVNPSDCCAFSSRVEELLEEYGEDNDLPEGWWMYEGDIDDWLLKL